MIDLPSEVAQLSPKLVGKFLILVGQGNPKGAVSEREVRSRGCWARLIADLMSFLDYFNFKNIPFKVLHSCKKKSCVDKNPRRKRPIFVMENTFFGGRNGIQSTNEMAFKRTVTLREFSISRHQIWCAHAILVQRMPACGRKMLSC